MLRLDSVEIQRFRGIREGKLEGLADVNVLIGRNNSGKSTVLEAITAATDRIGSSGALSQRHGRLRREAWLTERSESDSNLDWFYRRDGAAGLKIRLGVSGSIFEYQFWMGDERRDQVAGNGEAYATWARNVAVFLRHDLGDRRIEQDLWEGLVADRRDKNLVASMNSIFEGGLEQLQPLPNGKLLFSFADRSVPLDLQGDGVRGAFRSLMMLSAVQAGTFMLEEPECHQHPGALRKFAIALCTQAKKQEVQLIITTHSTECIDAFLEASREAQSEAAVFHLRLNDGVLDARRLSSKTAATMEESGVDLRELDLYA